MTCLRHASIAIICITGLLPFFVHASSTAQIEIKVDIGVCGDGIVGLSEDCDGVHLDGATCQSEGFSDGTISCTSACDFDTSACTVADDSSDSGSSESSSNSSSSNESESVVGAKTTTKKATSDTLFTTAQLTSERERIVTAPIEDFTQIPRPLFTIAEAELEEEVDQESLENFQSETDTGTPQSLQRPEPIVAGIINTARSIIQQIVAFFAALADFIISLF